MDANPPDDKVPPSHEEMREVEVKSKDWNAAGACNITGEMLQAGGEAMARGLHPVLAVWCHSSRLAKGLAVPIRKGKGFLCTTATMRYYSPQRAGQGYSPSVPDVDSRAAVKAAET